MPVDEYFPAAPGPTLPPPSSTEWVTKTITSELEAGRPRAFTSGGDNERSSRNNLYCLCHPPLSNDEYAGLALSLFEKTKEFASVPQLAAYEVREALGASRALYKVSPFEFLDVLDWSHVSFIATSDTGPPLLCFAELVDFGFGDQLLLNTFSFVRSDCSAISYGCGFCPPHPRYPHPPSMAFSAGRWEHCPIDMDDQKKLASAFRRKVVKQDGTTSHRMFHLCHLSSHADPPVVGPVYDPSRYTPTLLEEGYAAIALDHIKQKEGEDYELVNTLFAHCKVLPSEEDGFDLCCHVAFVAEHRNNPSAPWVNFFVEMKDKGEKEFLLHQYCTFDLDDPSLMEGCGICPQFRDLPHPSGRRFHYTLSCPKISDFTASSG